jgi:16S rRNA (uracil1498-N3)-methyltransferase
MYNFFVSENAREDGAYLITGADFNHIKNVLRMRSGDTLLVSCDKKSDLCVIDGFSDDAVNVRVVEENYRDTELPIKIYLFQGLPKSDKLELIIQKCVELGVYAIAPVEMNRCVVKLDAGKKSGKTARWQAISESAAKQSKRNFIPEIMPVMSYAEMLDFAKNLDVFMIPYENKDGMLSTKNALEKIKSGMSVGILIGPEGGFEEREVEKAMGVGGISVSLGKRILRTETAAITSVSMCMLYAEMNIEDKI